MGHAPGRAPAVPRPGRRGGVTPDVNILVAAARAEHPHHVAARTWLGGAVTSVTADAPLLLLPSVAIGFVRVVTDRRFYSAPPTSTRDALANVAALVARRHVTLGVQGADWGRVTALCEQLGLAGPVLTDAWLAASVLQLDEHLVTFDRGFRRLLPPRHLTVLDPASTS